MTAMGSWEMRATDIFESFVTAECAFVGFVLKGSCSLAL